MTETDETLVGRAQRGDHAAFEELVRRTSRLIFARLYLETGDSQAAVNEISTEQKFGYQVTLLSVGNLEPRETVKMQIEVKDVEKKALEIIDLVKVSKGQANKAKSGLNKQGQMTTLLVIKVPLAASDTVVRQIKGDDKVVDWDQTPNVQAPDNELATAQIVVLLTGPNLIVPNDESIGENVRTSLYYSFKFFTVVVMFIIMGFSIVLPCALVIFACYWMVRKIWPAEEQQPADSRQQAASGEEPKP